MAILGGVALLEGCALVEGSMSPRRQALAFEGSYMFKPHPGRSLLPVAYIAAHYSLSPAACLQASMLPTMMIMDQVSETVTFHLS